MAVDLRSKKWLWVGVLAAMVVLAFAVVACGGDKASGPEQAAQALLDAMEAKDVDAYIALFDPAIMGQMEAAGVTPDQLKEMIAEEAMTEESIKFDGIKFETVIAEDGKSATVTVVEGTMTKVIDGQTSVENAKDSDESMTLPFILGDDGKWYLDISNMM